MNDKIKELLENAEQSDAIAINKWRIENREQLRKERKEKLKELMEKETIMSNNKQSMKKLLIATLLIGMVSSCKEPTTTTQLTEHSVKIGVSATQLKVVEIEGCEYFMGDYDRSALFAHKGNCKNLIHIGDNK
jgi:predicted GTPase